MKSQVQEQACSNSEAYTGVLSFSSFCAVFAFALSRHWLLPTVRRADAALSEGFSAERAREVVADLGTCGFKYIGSEALELCAVEHVQRHIQKAVGQHADRVSTSIQSASGTFYLDFLGGLTSIYRNLTNVVARVRRQERSAGSVDDSGCALLISSHFDSTFGSPAAADANAEIAIMMDLLRLFAHEPLPVDVIFNFNGGEEMLLQAAHGFITSHPWAKDICAAINLESAGAGGRELLFQSGPRNRWVAEAYGKRVARPYAHSLTQVFFDQGIIPGDTDYRIYRDFGGLPGADFAIISNDWVYHTERDTLAHTDWRSIQRYGETACSLAQGIADVLKGGVPTGLEAEEEAVYFDVAGVFFITYSAHFARQLHIATVVVALTWILSRHLACFGHIVRLSFALLAGWIACTLSAVLCGLLVALSPAALVGSGHPELTLLLYAPPAILTFLKTFEAIAGARVSETDVASASGFVAAAFCLAVSISYVGASYLFFLWLISPLCADVLCILSPTSLHRALRVIGFIPPWLIQTQLLILALDLFCPLTLRSGTIVPGDVIVAALYGIGCGFYLMFSAPILVRLPQRSVNIALWTIMVLGCCLATTLFPYSYDRPKRIFMQHVARSSTKWDLTTQNITAQKEPLAGGIWVVAMDWNNVGTIDKYTPFGLPSNSMMHDDSIGLYGEQPYPFPIKPFVSRGVVASRSSPDLPSELALEVTASALSSAHERRLHFSIKGGAHIRVALGPRSLVTGWSLGFFPAKDVGQEALGWSDAKDFPRGLPPARSDCDCYWVLFSEGGKDPTLGRAEAFNFSVSVKPGNLQLDMWTLHLETTSSEIRQFQSQMPHWVNFAGWVAEVQLHKFKV